jgi:DNA helicase-2/ATP-dependent DNA helicase PcrA
VSDAEVIVRRGSRYLLTIQRPIKETSDGPAVLYKGRLWRLSSDGIDVDGEPLPKQHGPEAREVSESPSAPILTLHKMQIQDDSDVRRDTVEAPASARQLVEAGPGTGKTELAARRIADLIRRELSPGQILVLSFSRSAVQTLTRRLGLLGDSDARVVEELRHLSIRTFDSWAFRMLRLMGESPANLLARGHDRNIAELTKLASGPRRDELRSFIGERRHLIVDEFQDLPGVRGDLVLALLDLLAQPSSSDCGFTILGDPAQAIYAFARGNRDDGTPYPSPQEYWRKVCATYGQELSQKTLSRNYRAQPALAQLSAELRKILLGGQAEEDKLRAIKAAVSALPSPEERLGRGMLQSGAGGSRAILTHTNGEALRVLKKIMGSEVEGTELPLLLKAGSHANLPPAWIAALLRKMRSTSLPRSQFGKVYKHLTAQWTETTRKRLGLPEEEFAWARLARGSGAPDDTTSIDVPELRARLGWPDTFPDDQPLVEGGVIITTVHQSKGMEFDVVTVLEEPSRETSSEHDEDDSTASDQASVAYVAMTRAAKKLERVDYCEIYTPPTHWKFADSRRRLCHWRSGWVNMEMGLKGDLDPLGFVDPTFLGGLEGVEKLQSFLVAEASKLVGRKVMLCKQTTNGKAEWHIHLQIGDTPGQLIGRTTNQLSLDLLHMLHGKGFPLPSRIFNLRISSVGTVTSDNLSNLGEPERTSGLWLGVGLFGTGDFKTIRRTGQ